MLFGIVFLSHQIGSFLGVWLAGRLFDLTGPMSAMWWISVALGVISAAAELADQGEARDTSGHLRGITAPISGD